MLAKHIRYYIYRYIDAVKILMGLSDIMFIVNEINDPDDIAYTMLQPGKRADIFINPHHSVFNTPSEDINIRNYMGVLIHEMLHKAYTDPGAEKLVMTHNPIRFTNLFHDIMNIIEDFTIESRCILTMDMSEDMLDAIRQVKHLDLKKLNPVQCLDSSILTIWKMSPPIEDVSPEAIQLLNAMIMFGDMGPLVPGSRVKEELKNDLKVIYSEMLNAIFEEPYDRALRAYTIYKIFEKYCPDDIPHTGKGTTGQNGTVRRKLTKEELDRMRSDPRIRSKSKLLKKIEESLSKDESSSESSGSPDDSKKDELKSSGSGKPGKPPEKDEDSTGGSKADADKKDSSDKSEEASKGKSESAEEKTDKEEKDSKGSSSEKEDEAKEDKPSESESKPAESKDEEKSESEDKPSDKGDSEDKDDPSEKDSDEHSGDKAPEEKCESPEKENLDEEGESSEEDDPDDEGDKSEDPENTDKDAEKKPPEEPEKDSEEENGTDPFLGDEETAASIKDVEEIITKEKIGISEASKEEADFSKTSEPDAEESRSERTTMPAYKGTIKCKNFTVTGVSSETMEAYNEIIRRNRVFVKRFSNKLRNLAHEGEKRESAKSGHLVLTRYAKRHDTSLMLFDKRTRKERTNARVIIALDVSGSMMGNKIAKAKEALACIVEALTSADIPVKVMTFCNNYDDGAYVEHHHYVNFKTSRSAKSSIMMIKAGGDNFDGYSIRYGLKDLMKLRTKNHLLIVISDGQPATAMVSDPVADAINAVTEAKRKTQVIGIGVDAGQEILKRLYKDTFVSLTNIEGLMAALSKIFIKEVRKWA